MVESILTLITGLIFWQSIFNNNVVLFKVRLNLYQRFSQTYYNFTNIAETFNNSTVKELVEACSKGNSDFIFYKKDVALINELSKLEGIISEIELMDFSPEITSHLQDIKNNSIEIFNHLTKRKSIEEKQFKYALKNIKAHGTKNSNLALLFRDELQLRNLRYYKKKVCHYLCKK